MILVVVIYNKIILIIYIMINIVNINKVIRDLKD